MSDQLKLGLYLWTRAPLVARDYDLAVSLTTVGRYLKKWGFGVQKTVRRAYERNDVARARWLKTEYPAIVRDAKCDGARSIGAMKWGCTAIT